jgi:hypothetical protein
MKSFYQFYQEISQDIADEVSSADRSESPVFGNKLRIVIPLSNQSSLNFERELEKLGVKPNLQTGMVDYQVKTKNGLKTRQQRIGTFLGDKLKREPSEDIKKLFHWWEKNKANINNNSNFGVSVIISRSPIDIVRMSDHSEWRSCHSQGDLYFHCAIEEAKTGGAVAYVVKNSDLKQVEDLQAKDIFKDKKRNIHGIEPLERLRLRRFTNKADENIELLIPELKTYGIKHVGFEDAVQNWAKHVQRDILSTNPDFKDYDLRGGSYQDNDAGDLWSKFLDKDIKGIKKSIDKNSKDGEDWQTRADELIAHRKFQHWRVYAITDFDYDQPTLFANADCMWEFPDELFIKNLTDKDLKTYHFDKKEPVPFGSYLKKQLSSGIEELSVDERGSVIRITVSVTPDDVYDPDTLERFLDSVDDYEKQYEKDYGIIWNCLLQYGFVKERELTDLKFKHFHTDSEYDERELNSELMEIGDLTGVNPSFVESGRTFNINGKNLSYLRIAKPKINPNEIFGIKEDWVRVCIDETYHKLSRYEPLGTPNQKVEGLIKVYLYVGAELSINKIKEKEELEAIERIDRYWEYFYQRSIAWWNKTKSVIVDNPQNTIHGFGAIRLPQLTQPQHQQMTFKNFLQGQNQEQEQ